MATKTTTRLSAGAVHLLSILDGYCTASARTRGEAVAFVSQAKLAERLQRSIPTVKRCLAELVAANLVTVSRGYRAMNRYAMIPSNGSSMIPSDGSPMIPSDGSPVIRPNGSPMSRLSAAPISSDLVFTQQHLTPAAAGEECAQNAQPAEPSPSAAADGSAPGSADGSAPLEAIEAPDAPAPVSALEVLTMAGLAEAVARPYAEADAGGLCHLAAAYYAERAAKGNTTLGLLRDMLNKPGEYFREDTAGNWLPPRDSMIHKSMKAAEVAMKRQEQAALLRLQEQERKRLEAESAANSAAQLAADVAAWRALSDWERRGIEQGVGRELPATMSREAAYPNGATTHFRLRCYQWMRQYAAAAARETAWHALPPPVQAQLEADARKRFPLWAAATADALHSICLMLMPAPPATEGQGHG